MATETEMKLAMAPGTGDAVVAHPMVAAVAVGEMSEKRLLSIYFDTDDLALKGRKIALRVRHKGGKFIQTLKTKGSAQGGLFVRRELECEVAAEAVEIDKIDDDELRAFVAGVGDRLEPAFVTDFVRRKIVVRPTNAKGTADVELCVDEGEVRARGLSEPLHEVELELVTGDVDAMLLFAEQLREQFGLTPDDRSKAARGYGLFTDPS